jgi:hypothetical protein
MLHRRSTLVNDVVGVVGRKYQGKMQVEVPALRPRSRGSIDS